MILASVCDAMRQAGITDGNSKEGEDFCVNKCPYRKCILTSNNTDIRQTLHKPD